MIKILLKDRTTGKNILWANSKFGAKEIQLEEIYSIKPRHEKIRAQQKQRTRERAEIFTPPDVCEIQNDLLADEKKISSPWTDYVDRKFLEITCGEAPYITTRYNAVTGAPIPIQKRVGLLDRKLKLINQQVRAVEDWKDFAARAVRSVYGYEFQGDNLFLARKNILLTVEDFYREKYFSNPPEDFRREVAEIISWNLWQMDGITNAIPYYKPPPKNPKENPNQGTLGGFGEPENVYCKIKDWYPKEGEEKTFEFRTLLEGGRR